MYWMQTKRVDKGRYLAAAVRIVDGHYMEFAGVGETEAEAKSKATLRMWRASRELHGLPTDEVVKPPRRAGRPQHSVR